jgi:putative membrane protein
MPDRTESGAGSDGQAGVSDPAASAAADTGAVAHEVGRDWTARAVAGIYLRGLCMGAADAVPGVSGGTIALITGIYERLITALTAVSPRRIAAVLGLALSPNRPSARRRARQALVETDALFLVVLGFGVVSAIVAVASTVEIAVEQYPVPTFGFFLGLIGASAIVLSSDVTVETPTDIAAGALGFVIAFFVSGQAANGLGHTLPVVFVAGAIAVSAMILPGISGSLLLLLLGQYTYMVETLSALRDSLLATATGGDATSLLSSVTTAGVFVAGALVGLFTVAHVVRFALDRRRQATLAFLLLLIVGALRAPIIRISLALSEAGRGWDGAAVAVVAAATLVGVLTVLVVERAAGGIQLEG